jgi:large subunit ribosomal protein L31
VTDENAALVDAFPVSQRGSSMTHQPTLYRVDVRCASCGTTFALRSTAEALSTDVCSNCHPAYTGQDRATVSGSRIDRFNKRRALAAA